MGCGASSSKTNHTADNSSNNNNNDDNSYPAAGNEQHHDGHDHPTNEEEDHNNNNNNNRRVSVEQQRLEEERQYVAKIEQDPKVHKLPNGMYFKILTPTPDTKGKKSPTLIDLCKVHYHGTFANGKVFDSSIQRGSPATFAPTQVIKGWTEALQMMTEGEEWEVCLPAFLGYGREGQGKDVPPNSMLIFTIQLIKVMKGGKSGAEAHEKLERLMGVSYEELC